MKEKELQVYHTALTNFENYIIGSPTLSPTTILENLIKDTQNSPSLDNYPKIKKDLIKQLQSQMTACKVMGKINPSQATQNLIKNIRKKRKPLDSLYIETLINSSPSNQKEAINSAKSFFALVKEQDPFYYDEILYTTLEHFKNIPTKLNLKEDEHKTYTVTPQEFNIIKNTQKFINQIVAGYQIEEKENPEKPYPIRFLDRTLFDGYIKTAPHVDLNSPTTFPTSQEAIDMLENEQQKGGKYENDGNAKIITELLKSYMQSNNQEQTPFPILINKLIKKYNIQEEYKFKKKHKNSTKQYKQKTKIKFQTIQRDMWGEFSYDTNQSFQDLYVSITKKHFSRLKPGLKYQYRQQIESTPQNLALLCEQTEALLLNECQKYGLDKDVILTTFGSMKLTADNKVNPNCYKQIYHWLTSAPKNKKALFVASLHHDKERVNTSINANNAKNNFILALAPKENINFIDIYERMLEYLNNLSPKKI